MNEPQIREIQTAVAAARRELQTLGRIETSDERIKVARASHEVAKDRLTTAARAGRDATTLEEMRLQMRHAMADLTLAANLADAWNLLDSAIDKLVDARGAAREIVDVTADQAILEGRIAFDNLIASRSANG